MGNPPLILVVDDDPDSLAFSVRVLEKAGLRVSRAETAAEVLPVLSREAHDLVLLDIMLPDATGFDVLLDIRGDTRLAGLPVVFLSSRKVSPEDQAAGLDAGADGYIARPVSGTELLARVRLHLRQRELTERLRASEARFRDLIERQADGVLVVDREGTIQFANPAAESLFGRTQAELADGAFGFPLDSTKPREVEIRRPDGVETIAEFRVNETEWEARPAWIVTLNDVTERFRAQAERTRLLRDLGERVKELRLYHGASEILRDEDKPLEELLDRIVRLIPPAMQYNDCAEARIALGGTTAATPGFRRTGPVITAAFALRGDTEGRIDVVYTRTPPEGAEPAFNEEEQQAIDALGGMLRNFHERRSIEEERARATALLKIAGSVARIGGWTIELPERKLTWSDEVRGIHEIPGGEQPTLEEAIRFYPDEYRAEVAGHVERCIEKGIPFQFELELITAKQQRIWVTAIGEAVRDASGKFIRVQGAFQDITARKEAEASAEESERRFRHLAESMPMIVWTARPDGTIDYANQRLFEMTEANPEENPHTRWQHFVHPEDLDGCLRRWQECVAKETPYDTEYRLRSREGGAYRWIRVQAVPVRDASGEVVRWYGTGMDIHAIKSLQEEATEAADRLTRTFESITDGFFTLDRDWKFTYINAELEAILGRKRESLLDGTLWNAFPDVCGTPFEQAYKQAMSQQETVRIEDYFAPMQQWLDIRIYPFDGGLSVFVRDVTQKREDEEQMRLLAEAVDNLNDIVIVTKAHPQDEPGPEIVFVNKAFERLTGYTAAEVIGKTPRILQGPRTYPKARKRMRAALVDGTPICEEVINYGKDGTEYLLDVAIQPVHDRAGELTHFVAIQRDITKERAVIDELRESEERFRTLLEDIPTVAVQGYGLDGSVHYWNKASESLYGYTREEALKSNILDLIIPPDLHDDVRSAIAAIQNGEDRIPVGELSLLRKDGSRVDVLSSYAVLRRSGRPVELFSLDLDLTERKKLEAQFLRAQRMESLGTLAGGIAHDLNNILSPIMMGASLLRELDEEEKLHPIIDNIQQSAGRGRALVKQVLSFARGADGARVTVRIDGLVREVEAIVENTFPKNIVFERNVPAEVWAVKGDPTQLNQVLLNLCVNARDAMPEGGRLRVRAENMRIDRQYAAMFTDARPGPYVIIEVCDDGCGMKREVIDRIFEPFFTTKEFGEGTGLGLSTALGIVRGHGGFVNVYSEVGKGSRFKIFLPAQTENASAPEDRADTPDIPRGNGERILIVDDEEPIRNMTRETLEAFGYTVITAEDGAQATGIVASRKDEIDLVLTDIMMPVMDGVALIRALHRIVPDLPIIAASGLKTNGSLARAEECGVRHFLQKPYTAETILRTVHAALHGK